MKKLLLVAAFLGLAHSASAQGALVHLLATGVRLGLQAANKNADGKPQTEKTGPDVQQVGYRARYLGLKRTPPAKLHGKGGTEIGQLEELLQQCYATMTTDSLGTVVPDERLTAIRARRAQVSDLRPNWNQDNYFDEYNFYLAEDARRQRVARARATPAVK